MVKKSKAFRLDSLANERLESISKSLEMSQTDLVESLIHGCFDSYWENFEQGSFGRLERMLKDRLKMIQDGNQDGN